MHGLKRLLSSPYLYIFLGTYYGVWLLWDSINLPYHDPAGIISYLPSIQYNPANNIARFLAAVLLPPVMCLVFWFLTQSARGKKLVGAAWAQRTLTIGLIIVSLLLALCMGIVQGSSHPSNNPADAYGGPSKYAVLDTFHEGESLGPAVSYSQKDLKPYRDFVIVHGVFQDPLSSLIAFKIFGRSIGAARTFGVMLVMATFVLYYLLLLVIFRGNALKSAAGLGLLAILLMPSDYLPWLGKYILGVVLPFRDFATIFFLMAAITGLRSAIARRPKALIASSGVVGLLATASYADSIDRAFYISALSVLWLVMVFVLMPFRRFWRQVLAPYIAGGLAGTLILGFALKWAFTDFLSYLWTMSRYKEYLDGVVFGRPNIGVSLVLVAVSVGLIICVRYVYNALSAGNPGGKSWQVQARIAKRSLAPLVTRYYMVILLFATGICFLRSAVGRALPDHFYYSVQWLYLLLAFMLISYAFSSDRKKTWRQAVSFMVVLLFGIICLSYAYAVKSTDMRNNTFPLHLKDEQLVRSDYLQTADYLRSNLHGKQSFVTLTSEASWYYLVNKPSPIPYEVIWYAFTAEQREKIAQPLETDKNIKYVVTNNNWTSNFDYIPNPARFPEVYKVLYENYVPHKGIGQQTVWIRK